MDGPPSVRALTDGDDTRPKLVRSVSRQCIKRRRHARTTRTLSTAGHNFRRSKAVNESVSGSTSSSTPKQRNDTANGKGPVLQNASRRQPVAQHCSITEFCGLPSTRRRSSFNAAPTLATASAPSAEAVHNSSLPTKGKTGTIMSALVLNKLRQNWSLGGQQHHHLHRHHQNNSTTSRSIDDSAINTGSVSGKGLAPTTHNKTPSSKRSTEVHRYINPVLCLLCHELWSDDQAIVSGALEQLSVLCREDDIDDRNKVIFSLVGYTPLCGVLRKWYYKKEVLIAGFRLIHHLTQQEKFVDGVFGCGGLEIIVSAMEKFVTDGSLQGAACAALATIISSTPDIGPSIKLAVDMKNGVHVLIQAMVSFPDSIEVQREGYVIFSGMARFPSLYKHLNSGTTVVRAALEKFDFMSLAVERQDGFTRTVEQSLTVDSSGIAAAARH